MGKGKKNAQHAKIETFRGSFYSNVFASASTYSGKLSPNNTALFGNRINAMAALFNLYRFTDLKFSWCTGTGSGQADAALGLVTGVITTDPSTIAQISELEYMNVSRASQTVLTHLNVPKSFLLGCSPAKWWKTVPDAGQDDWDEFQGEVFGAASASIIASVLVEYVIEFTAFAADANTPLMRSMALQSGVRQRSSRRPDGTPAPSGLCADSASSEMVPGAAVGFTEEDLVRCKNLIGAFLSSPSLLHGGGAPGM